MGCVIFSYLVVIHIVTVQIDLKPGNPLHQQGRGVYGDGISIVGVCVEGMGGVCDLFLLGSDSHSHSTDRSQAW